MPDYTQDAANAATPSVTIGGQPRHVAIVGVSTNDPDASEAERVQQQNDMQAAFKRECLRIGVAL